MTSDDLRALAVEGNLALNEAWPDLRDPARLLADAMEALESEHFTHPEGTAPCPVCDLLAHFEALGKETTE
jgi:hypothetical protein